MRITTVVGARPQFIKASAVSRALSTVDRDRRGLHEVMVHTGQHYDDNMSDTFFRELDMPRPAYHLGVGGLPHGALTGRILESLEKVLEGEQPDVVLVYGDTDSTLAGALAAVKLNIPVAHVEAGLRSFNRVMPEEINRVVTDHVSSLLFCPTSTAVQNLENEGIRTGAHLVGDVMYDVALHAGNRARVESVALDRLDLTAGRYALATVHRQENTDSPDRLAGILEGLRLIGERLHIVFPLHPRTRAAIERLEWQERLAGLQVIDPVSYLDMVALETNAATIITDSGGVQKEAFFYGVPCVTLRGETEWVETVTANMNRLAGADPARMLESLDWAFTVRSEGTEARDANAGYPFLSENQGPYGDGRAAEHIVQVLWDTYQ